MADTWNNVELSNISRRKSYTLNHDYDANSKDSNNHNKDNKENINEEAIEPPSKATILEPGSDIKPKVTNDHVESLLRRLYGVTIGDIRELISYDDRNYFVKEDPNVKNPFILTHCPYGYVLKIINSMDSKKVDFIDAQNQLLLYLAKQNIQCPRPVQNVNGKYYSIESVNENEHIIRLLEFIPGKLFHEIPISNYLLFQSGEYLAKLNKALRNFHHIAYEKHHSTWQLQMVPKLRDFLYVLKDPTRKLMIEEIVESFEKNVLEKLNTFPKQIIHGDYNEQNIIVQLSDNGKDYKVVGVIDFGDTSKSPMFFEVGIGLTYMLLQAKNLESGGIFLAGFETIQPLTENEKSYLKYCVAARLAQSLVLGSYTHSIDPTNEYVLVTQEQGWKLIEELWCDRFNIIDDVWQDSADKYLTQSCK
uniref:Hydroxylysine kinase n=1 Tax=Glossina brevipalpis TaxID=37001 RepID=A0A1A9WKZ4_9MUSC